MYSANELTMEIDLHSPLSKTPLRCAQRLNLRTEMGLALDEDNTRTRIGRRQFGVALHNCHPVEEGHSNTTRPPAGRFRVAPPEIHVMEQPATQILKPRAVL